MPCIVEYQVDVQLHWSIIDLSDSLQSKNTCIKIVTMFPNERQQSVNDFWSFMLDNLMVMERS